MRDEYTDESDFPGQMHPIEGRESEMAQNGAGGYAFKLDCWGRLDRFLILGADSGAYQAGAKQDFTSVHSLLDECLADSGGRLVGQVCRISASGRAPKNSPALYALAYASKKGTPHTQAFAYKVLGKVARTGTHLFEWAHALTQIGHITSGAKKALTRWYHDRGALTAAVQVTKYPSRAGWSHRDLLRLGHVAPMNQDFSQVFAFAVGKYQEPDKPETEAARYLKAVSVVKRSAHHPALAAALIGKYKLPHEVVPTELLTSPEVWQALLGPEAKGIGITALIRNLGRLTALGLFQDDAVVDAVSARLTSAEALAVGRVHPVQMLSAFTTYSKGRGDKGSLSWNPSPDILQALSGGFYTSFKVVEPANKRILVALDVSGSMSQGQIAGMSLTPREAGAALVLALVRSEPQVHVCLFSHTVTAMDVPQDMALDVFMDKTKNLPFSATDCSAAIAYAERQGLDVDAFVIITDNETWAGQTHPSASLARYRKKVSHDVRMAVIGMTSTRFTLADPKDPGMLDMVGFDSAGPQVLSSFLSGDF